jgi:type IX secretion system PorP/SprF family membrane protein
LHMKKVKLIAVLVCMVNTIQTLNAQDPSFSQFFSSPLNINPALTGNINSDWRLLANFRDQWIGPGSPYVTGTLSYDRKVFQNKIPNVVDEGNFFGVGGMVMFDHAFSGIVKSTYASLHLGYNIKLADADERTHRLEAGFGATYGQRRVDFSGVDFEEQFTGLGFNTNLPTGEVALANSKPYFSVSAGLVYSYRTENSNFDMGAAAYHVNKPRQTFLKDENQILAMRRVAHANFETYLNPRLVLSTNAIYQYQDEARYFSAGGSLGYFLGDYDTMINAGLWYWSENALIPYLGISFKSFQFGLSYDVTTSSLNQAAKTPNTWEFSLIHRGSSKPGKIIPCPWK